MLSWFEEWFNSPYYKILYKHRTEQEAALFLNRLIAKYKWPKTCNMLDLACGEGRHALFLAQQNYCVTGIDIASNSIQKAREQAKLNRLSSNSLNFVVGDMRQPFGQQQYQVIFNLFTSFGYFEQQTDNLTVLHNAHKALLPNGHLLIDFMNTHKIVANLVPHETKMIDGIYFEIWRYLESGYIVKKIAVSEPNSGKILNFYERVQAIYPDDFKELFAKSSFKTDNLFGNYNLSDYDSQTSERQIWVLKPL
ncbi:MAG: class I SAM-dependent methyltransferase [Sphingobacteriales bacterium]|jgi:SAM-dependent methyltransferase|nr:class I SAM-dependent methyltransferase [Sphingobacteriales bacterium]MBP9140255.1 class I SAM-dependent methyltransferase [Chitinophagales bacterium]MDA0197611.1 class I SAM-dependent methyltransferase [Bacteroidota bacterium]MBK6889030.1 class I SAM-dependent methyltransferase [Sphingobacteriales bacterium]MBK7528466.1 class I SAM-dependent methyltransferase [Sphingobacteriales bacterium]